ncbi:MAG: twin-arginine translocation pathway signal protein, partial [Ramlibacter sp.]|nr:twin-arginine translocation pathway signal protein [Ramlibacter sp.]
QANPKNRVPFNIEDAHFAIAAVSVPGSASTGSVFQASKAEDYQHSELGFLNGRPRARWVDAGGQTVEIVSPSSIAANTPSVVAFTSTPGAQSLRVNTAVVATSYASLSPSAFTQMLIGWGFYGYYPRDGFMGNVYSVISGKGSPSAQEMAVLERYLGSTAGISI